MDATICLWALEDDGMQLLNTMILASPIRLMCITEDDVFVLACGEDNQLYLRTLTTGTELHALRGPKIKVNDLGTFGAWRRISPALELSYAIGGAISP